MKKTHPRRRWARPTTALALIPLALAAACSANTSSNKGSSGGGVTTLNIAVVANPDMQRMEQLAPQFEAANPKIKVKFTTLDEVTLRDKLTQDIATKAGAYDIAMIGVTEVPQWAKNGWIVNLKSQTSDAAYDVNDLLPSVHSALSYNGDLYAVPFYAESSFLMYRKDLFKAAGLTMPSNPSWSQINAFAAKLNNPSGGVAGICLRGQAGWGSNMGMFTTMLHAYGGTLFDPTYHATLNTPQAKAAITDYVNTVRNYGEKGATSNSFPECLNNFSQGHSAMWYDATVAASAVTDPKSSKVANDVGFAPAPQQAQNTGGWLWSWSLALVQTSKHQDAAWQFMKWATSKDYIKLVDSKFGPNLIPPGTRTSTYQLPDYQKAASAYATLTLNGINSAKTSIDGAAPLEKSFYVDVPQWEDTGTTVSQFLTEAIAGKTSIDSAISGMDKALNQMAKTGGYQN